VVLAEHIRPELHDPATRSRVQQELAALLQSVNRELPHEEQLRMIVIAREPWSIENGCLTPTMKIRRGNIEASVAAEVPAWYAGPGGVHWA